MTDLLKRELAPITPEAWEQVDDEARRLLALHLTGRKLVDFSGPHGWALGGINTGHLKVIDKGPVAGVPHAVREVQPLVEIRSPFAMKLLELDYAARGARDLDLDPVIAVAERVARAEDTAIFHGFKEGRITGIIEASPHAAIYLKTTLEWPRAVAAAKEVLRAAGVDGPYALALGSQAYAELAADSEDGYPLASLLERRLGHLHEPRAPEPSEQVLEGPPVDRLVAKRLTVEPPGGQRVLVAERAEDALDGEPFAHALLVSASSSSRPSGCASQTSPRCSPSAPTASWNGRKDEKPNAASRSRCRSSGRVGARRETGLEADRGSASTHLGPLVSLGCYIGFPL
jgi:uncharacterized linocin/CFP29 family protein